MSIRANAQSLRGQIEAVVDADWSHTAWWGLTWLTGALERFGRPPSPRDRLLYHQANGGPHSDTFMGRPRGKTKRWKPAERAAWAISAATRGMAAIEELDSTLPNQRLWVTLTWRGRWLTARPLEPSDRTSVVFTVGGTHYVTRVSGGNVPSIQVGLESLCAGGPAPGFHRIHAGRPVRAALAVSLDEVGLGPVRHTHRNTWSSSGGPWLGIGRTKDLDVVTTCHLVVDGLGHALLTDRIVHSGVGDAGSVDSGSFPRGPRTGVAWRVLPRGAGRFTEMAYATGLTLEAFHGGGGHAPRPRRFSPPFTVPVAPGDARDPSRRLGRVVHGLLSVKKEGSGFESFQAFASRVPTWLEMERREAGVLARISSAVSRGPLPRPLQRFALSNHHGPRHSIPSVEGLSGRARLSVMRFPEGPTPAPPLVAASLPTLLPNIEDARGSVVLTIVHHEGGSTVTAFGTGLAGSAAGATAFLDTWLDTLDAVRGA